MRTLVYSAVFLACVTAAEAQEITPYQSVTSLIADIESALSKGTCGFAGNMALKLSDDVDGLAGAIGVGLSPINRTKSGEVDDYLLDDDLVRGTSVAKDLRQRRNELLVRAGECLVNGQRTKYARAAFAKALDNIDPADTDLWKRARDGLWDELGIPASAD